MSSENAIDLKNLSKCYYIYEHPQDRLKKMVVPKLQKALGLKPSNYGKKFWAVKNVSFKVKKGETIGIVGRNGSGKSTILQMICGTLNPTSGQVKTNGRIAALLELGSGFNPEFTGRENVYLNGSVLGMSLEEINSKLSEILIFADIGDFIDQPIKTYSNGMTVRLAFAIAINADPQILIVDEALSVGDELFQRKCFSRIEEIRAAGATILFVSHSGATVVNLCDQAILVDAGELLAIGKPKKIVGLYHKLLYVSPDRYEFVKNQIRSQEYDSLGAIDVGSITQAPQTSVDDNQSSELYDSNLIPKSTIVYESYGATIIAPEIFSLNGEKVNILMRGNFYCYRYKVKFKNSVSNVRFGMMIKTITGIELGGSVSAPSASASMPFVSSDSVVLIEFDFLCTLNPGIYFLNAGVLGSFDGDDHYVHRIVDAAMFRVMPENQILSNGYVDFSCQSRIKILNVYS